MSEQELLKDVLRVVGFIRNPLHDSGEALKIAATLCISIHFQRDEVICMTVTENGEDQEFTEPFGANRHAATCLAIVRAAAYIGGKSDEWDAPK